MDTEHTRPRTVNCPTCAVLVEWGPAQPWRPFCSERCRLIDLGSWFDESHRIAAEDATLLTDENDSQ